MREQSRDTFGLSVTLSSLSDPAPLTDSRCEFDQVKLWVDNWLGKSHPDLGRAGAVCPYSSAALKKNLFQVAFVRGNKLDHGAMVHLVEELAAAFSLLPPTEGPEAIYKTVVVVFPDLTDFSQIDAVQAECKTALVQRGLMVGQFYPGHRQGGLRNPEFKALDGPFAMLAIRHMVVTDYPFLCGDDSWIAAYDARFALRDAATCPVGDRHAARRPRETSTPARRS